MRKFAQQDVYTRFLLVLLVGMCINFVLECLLDLDLTLEDEKKKKLALFIHMPQI